MLIVGKAYNPPHPKTKTLISNIKISNRKFNSEPNTALKWMLMGISYKDSKTDAKWNMEPLNRKDTNVYS